MRKKNIFGSLISASGFPCVKEINYLKERTLGMKSIQNMVYLCASFIPIRSAVKLSRGNKDRITVWQIFHHKIFRGQQ